MLTLTIHLMAGEPFYDLVNQFDFEFPGLKAGNSLLTSHEFNPERTIELTLKEQGTLTDEQRDYLHLSSFALDFIESYRVDSTARGDVQKPDDFNAYAANIAHKADEATRHIIETMTPGKAVHIIKEGIETIRTAPDPDGENLGIEIRLSFVMEWLAGMEVQA